ncbi:MAG: hypothetical protein HY055_01020 [Magnetospirillum sp.]|nr:hypothetical protein [Magnetospirillum sp.]
MAGDNGRHRECKDCTYWKGWGCAIDDVRSARPEKKESRGCDYFIRDSLRFAFFSKI